MNTVMKNGYDVFGTRKDSRNDSSVSKRKKWIRCKEATVTYSIGRTKLTQLAREAGAVLKIDSTLLIDVETFEKYLETFRVRGGSF